MTTHAVSLRRRMAAEAVGTGGLVAVVVGSGIGAERLSPDAGLQLLACALATAAGLAVLVLVVGPASGAHLNPVVSLVDWWVGRAGGAGLSVRQLGAYAAAQVAGAAAGAVLANLMFDLPAVTWSDTARWGAHLWLAEVVATAGLVTAVLTLARAGRPAVTAAAVGAYIGSAYWWTSSTSFANPAVTAARTLSDTYAGIAPASVLPFVAAQVVGGALGVAVVRVVAPATPRAVADRIVVHAPQGT